MSYSYLGDCTQLPEDFINKIKEEGREILYETFLKGVPVKEVKKFFPNYDWYRNISYGLKLKDDFAVHFFKTKTHYFIVHSSIEYVWQVN